MTVLTFALFLLITVLVTMIINNFVGRRTVANLIVLPSANEAEEAYSPEIFEPDGLTALTPVEEIATIAYWPYKSEKVLYRTRAGNWLTARVVRKNGAEVTLRRRHHCFVKSAMDIRQRSVRGQSLAVAA